MRILVVASEAAPYLQTSDVASVVTGLAKELCRQGHDVRIAIPYYRNLDKLTKQQSVIEALNVPLGTYGRRIAKVWQTHYEFDDIHKLPFYLIENGYYFGRDRIYGYLDDYERFIFFTRATLEMLHHLASAPESWQPEVIHGHDWISGLIPMWLQHVYQDKFTPPPSLFVHASQCGLAGCIQSQSH